MKKAITSAIINILRPLLRILLTNNISFQAFSEIAKWVYVDVASKDFEIPGRKQSLSRVAVITGLSRKEVTRIGKLSMDSAVESLDRYHRAVRVINGWRNDPTFIDKKGRPKKLVMEGQIDSFAELVKKYSGDMPHRAVLDEIVRAGVAEYTNGGIHLKTEGYIVADDDIEKINILGEDTGHLISTVAHNMYNGSEEPFFQRKVSYDNVLEDALPELRKKLKSMSRKYLKSADRLISQYDKDINPKVKGKGHRTAGLGIFYFE